MKNDFVKPVLILALICLLVSGALAATNSVTQPLIESAAAERVETAKREAIPGAEGFELILDGAFPSSVKEAYKTTNNVGYIFMVTTTGFGGDIDIMCGIGIDGKLISSITLQHAETKGLGSKIADEPYASQYVGADRGLDGIAAITGATISSNAYMTAIRDAFEAFEQIGK